MMSLFYWYIGGQIEKFTNQTKETKITKLCYLVISFQNLKYEVVHKLARQLIYKYFLWMLLTQEIINPICVTVVKKLQSISTSTASSFNLLDNFSQSVLRKCMKVFQRNMMDLLQKHFCMVIINLTCHLISR